MGTAITIISVLLTSIIGILLWAVWFGARKFEQYKKSSDVWKSIHEDKLTEVKLDVKEIKTIINEREKK